MTDLDKTIADWREHGTPGPWSGHNMVGIDSKPMTAEEIGEYVTNSLKMADSDRFLFVSGKHEDGGPVDVCHTGNGPKGPYNTALISAAPAMADEIDRLKARIAELEAQVKEWKQGADAEARAGDEARARVAELEAVVNKLWRRQDSLDTFDAAVNEVLAPLFERQVSLDANATAAIFDDLDSLYEGKQNKQKD